MYAHKPKRSVTAHKANGEPQTNQLALRPGALEYLRLHPDATYAVIEEMFKLSKGKMANWVRADKIAKGEIKIKKRRHSKASIRGKLEKTKAKLAIVTALPPPTPPARPLTRATLDRVRAVMDRNVQYLEIQPLGTREYTNTVQNFRSLLDAWQSIPQIDERTEATQLPDLHTDEGRAALAAELAALPAGALAAAMRTGTG